MRQNRKVIDPANGLGREGQRTVVERRNGVSKGMEDRRARREKGRPRMERNSSRAFEGKLDLAEARGDGFGDFELGSK